MKVLHRASFVVPVASPLLEVGAVLTENGRILEVGLYKNLRGKGKLVDHGRSILTPALINCHAHLELSHLAELGKRKHQGEMPDWIASLLAMREANANDEQLHTLARDALHVLEKSGVALVADIGNSIESRNYGENAEVEVLFFLELLGLSSSSVPKNIERLAELDVPCTAHALYSTAGSLVKKIKHKARERNTLFPIHVAESRAELQFLADATGPFRSFIEERAGWDSSFQPPGCGAVEYLDRLGVLDEKTLCVHCVHVSDEEIELIGRRKAHICLCPGSNRLLGVGRAPVAKMVSAGIIPCLGTDSLASNPVLNLWQEMKILREENPLLDPFLVFAMATSAGASALHAGHLGELAPGKSASFLRVTAGDNMTAETVYDFLTDSGAGLSVNWVEERGKA
ncbi:MAG: amidohydrolase family protein [Desulfobulbaceae bacterium]|nr:amidohydrolase family protein [Desulfobulbaceae bacterium]